MMKNLVSIITPLYNAERFIDETIESVLAQTYSNWEMLIVDDCSTDNGVKIVEQYVQKDNRIKLIRLDKNSGASVARNRAIEESKGRFVAFLDSDDVWKPEKLDKQINFMLDRGIAFSYTGYEVTDEWGKKIGKVDARPQVDYKKMLRNNYIGCLTAMYDKEKVGEILMPAIRKRQDWALWLKILKHTPYALGLQDEPAVYRNRSKSISSNKIGLIKYNWKIYKMEGFSTLKAIWLLITFFYYYFTEKILNS